MRLDYNSEDQETLELVSSLRKYFFFFVLGWSSFVIPLTIFILVLDEPIVFIGLFVPWLIFTILVIALFASWSRRTEILLTSISLEIFVDRNILLALGWDEIERIIVFKEEWEAQITRYRLTDTDTGYSLRMKGFELDKTIRLWCLGFRSRNQKKIISFLKHICIMKNIQFSIDDTPQLIIERQESPCGDISQFREALDLEKRKRQGEKAVNGGHFW